MFGINKCVTLVVKPLHFRNQDGYVDNTFHLGINPIPKNINIYRFWYSIQ